MHAKENRAIIISVISILFISSSLSAAVDIYQKSRMDTIDARYAMVVDGTPVSVLKNCGVSYARFAMSGTVNVSISAQSAWTDVKIWPSPFNIVPTINGNALSFTLDQPRAAIEIVTPDKDHFFIFPDALEDNPPRLGDAHVKNVMDFYPDSTGATNTAAQLQEGIDWVSANAATKPVLYFPAGMYMTGQLIIKNNMHLYLESGACLIGTGAEEDYPPIPVGIDFNTSRAFLYCDSASDWNISGRGMIDLRGPEYQQHSHGLFPVFIRKCTRYTVDGLMIRNSDYWNVTNWTSSHGHIKNLKLLSPAGTQTNIDGVNHCQASFDTVSNCFHMGDDDSYNFGVNEDYADGTHDNLVQGCVAHTSRGSSYRIGVCNAGPMYNITFRNCYVLANAGAAIASDGGGWMGCGGFGKSYDIRWENIWADSTSSFCTFGLDEGSGARYNHDVVNCGFSATPEINGGGVWGGGDTSQFYNVRFFNLKRGDSYCLSAADIGMEMGAFTHDVTFVVDPDATRARQPWASGMQGKPFAPANLHFYSINGQRLKQGFAGKFSGNAVAPSHGIAVYRGSGADKGAGKIVLFH